MRVCAMGLSEPGQPWRYCSQPALGGFVTNSQLGWCFRLPWCKSLERRAVEVEVIDPLAAPWTARQNRSRGRRRMARKSPFSGRLGLPPGRYSTRESTNSPADARLADSAFGPAPAGATGGTATATATVAALDLDLDPDPELDLQAPSSSYLDAKPPHRTRSPRAGDRRPRRLVAVPVLALLVIAGLVLTGVIVRLVRAGMSSASGASAASSPLVVPAPALAAGLPRRYSPVRDLATQQLIAQFISRFTAVSGSHTGRPAAIYREPGTIDLPTGEPGWLMYIGYNSAASLGAPDSTIGRVMTDLTGSSAPDSSWRVAPGPRGGSSACAIASFGATPVSLCAWATEHTVGALMSPTSDTKGNELAALMPLMRLDLQPGASSRHVPGHAFD